MITKIKLSLAVSTLLATSVYGVDGKIVIVKSATKTTQKLTQVTSNINIITSKQLEQQQYATVIQALNSIVGVSFATNGGIGQSSSVGLRGMTNRRILILIDGVRYNDITGLSGAPLEHLMVSNIQQIEIIKGAQSGVWGADASAGVINIITKKIQNGLHGNINFEYGSFKTKTYETSMSYKTDKYNFKVNSHKVNSDGFTSQAPNGVDIDTLENDGYKNTTNSFLGGFSVSDTNKIDISHISIDATTQFDPFKNPNGIETSTIKNNLTSINFNHIDSFNEVDIYAKQSVFSRYYPQGFTKRFDGAIDEYGFKSRINYKKQDFILLGMDNKEFEHKNNLNKQYKNKGIFLTNSNIISSTNKSYTIFTQSIRYDELDEFNNKTTGKIGLKNFNDDITLGINYGTAYNIPTLYQLYDPFYGNTNTKSEEISSYDLSVRYKNLTLSYFNNAIKNMIGYDKITYQTTNTQGVSVIKGIEIEYKRDITKNTLLNFNYTTLTAKDKDENNLERRAKENLKVAINYSGFAKTNLVLNANYIGERYDDNARTKQTGKYTVINTVANYDINHKIKVYFKIDNITDKYYQTIEGYATSPRAYYAGIKIKF
ncbi:TonB-dependent receptor; Outer membrane receptor for ferrienterochelin and colicins [hydrothermal vent metagenome]|uniref:TonB-dependent receptor Outer membrane receptor for ferrienterochelin and colicins n=1 Tax=hydrothermal vent metagenome TaxID=652676 RepID=A0A3B1E0M6_9ZZZZ